MVSPFFFSNDTHVVTCCVKFMKSNGSSHKKLCSNCLGRVPPGLGCALRYRPPGSWLWSWRGRGSVWNSLMPYLPTPVGYVTATSIRYLNVLQTGVALAPSARPPRQKFPHVERTACTSHMRMSSLHIWCFHSWANPSFLYFFYLALQWVGWFYRRPAKWPRVMEVEYFDGLVQERRNSIALVMELCLSCTNPSICQWITLCLTALRLPVFQPFGSYMGLMSLRTLFSPFPLIASSWL